MTRRCIIVVCVTLLGLVPRAGAGWHSRVETVDNSGVDIELDSPVDHAPADGYIPCWITIKNRSGAARTWTIRGQGRGEGFGNRENTENLTQTLRVENEQSARMPVLVPLTPTVSSMYSYRPNSIEVEGYAVEGNSASVPQSNSPRSTPTAFMGIGETLATPIWGSLKKTFESRSTDLFGSPVEVALLGSDWRGLSGFDALWLTDKEYTGLEADRRLAIRRWVERGGHFILSAENLDPALRAGLGLPPTGDEAQSGFGSIKLLLWDGKELSLSLAASTIDAIRAQHHNLSDSDATGWPMTRSVGSIPLNAPFLIGFITLFAVLVGPCNLFWFAQANRRHRLFWTTPLISVGASLLLILVIMFQDGFGGSGERVMLTLLLPEQKEAVVLQEQVSRTGVLLSRRFMTTEDLVLSPVKVPSFFGKTTEQSGRDYAGDWFASRSVQAQRAEAVIPSRADIQLLNAAAAKTGAPPVVASSIPAALREIYYIDPDGHRWHGGSLPTGGRITLQPAGNATFSPVARGSHRLTDLQAQVEHQPGYFYATATDGPFIETLASIRWKKQVAVYIGPVSIIH